MQKISSDILHAKNALRKTKKFFQVKNPENVLKLRFFSVMQSRKSYKNLDIFFHFLLGTNFHQVQKCM